jgi:hypothetical protein
MYADFRRRHHMGQRHDQVVGSQPPSPTAVTKRYHPFDKLMVMARQEVIWRFTGLRRARGVRVQR